MWTQTAIHTLVEKQRAFFLEGKTLDIAWRIHQLKRLRTVLKLYSSELCAALETDLGRSEAEAYLADIGPSIMEINETIKGLVRWSKPETHYSGLHCFPSLLTKVYKMPYGVNLIISPFNFPVMLTLSVLAVSLAGGNTAVIKASSKSAHCTAVLGEMLREAFPEEYVCLVDGGHEVADMLLAERFDKIFYTGSPAVGRHVMAEAAVNLTPVALELGGETGNWCVVRKDADLKDAARKIAFFKIMNSGQICIDINQVAVAAEVADEFLGLLKHEFARQIGDKPLMNPEYTRLISAEAFEKCHREASLYRDRIIYGGQGDPFSRRFEPTVIYPVGIDEPIVKHELFNPLLPVVPYKDGEIDELLKTIALREHGLAFYLFTKDIAWAKKVMQTQQFGGGCINEVCLHLMVKGVPFGGTGHSGMGAYHGEWGFKEFTHPQTVLIGSNRFNLPLREHPYDVRGNWKARILKLMER